METDTAVEPREHLEQLRAELAERGWPAHIVGTSRHVALRVCNPDDGGLNVDIGSRDGRYHWPQGRVIDATDIAEAVAAITHVLRGVSG
ncbi:hypothetical protein [Nonomuraea longicatena]|uniref:Uncharacterized protein n=1 Tax=Nonomuraea longicatena TaxID=83682 RepID=A0ABP4ANN8_9ACTN